LAALRRNIAALGAGDRSRVAACDAEAFLEGRAGPAVDVDLLLADPDYGSWDAAWSARLDRGAGLRWSRGALRVLETSRREPEPMPAPGWRRWPARLYGETRITIEEREVADGADAGM
jgi:16S rRNA (guanine966-N2)-methyltransferase